MVYHCVSDDRRSLPTAGQREGYRRRVDESHRKAAQDTARENKSTLPGEVGLWLV